MAGDHLWSPTSVSVDVCYVGDNDCVVSGNAQQVEEFRVTEAREPFHDDLSARIFEIISLLID